MRIVRKLAVVAIGAVSTALSMGQAHAVSIIGSPTGLSNPAQTVTFGNGTFPNGTRITNQYSDSGITFNGSAFYTSAMDGAPNINGSSITTSVTDSLLRIDFTQNQTAAAFALVTRNSGSSIITAGLNGILVEQFVTATDSSSPNNFYGFSDIIFNQIVVNTGSLNQGTIDNIQLSTASAAVPFELSSGLGSAALAACGAIAYFKDNKKRKAATKVFSKG